MNDNPQNRTGDVPGSDYSSQGIPTSPLTGPAPLYSQSEARVSGPSTGATAAPPPPPGEYTGQYGQSFAPQGSTPQDYAQQWKGRNRRHAGSIVGPVILIGAGVVFLLNNLDVLPWSIWNQIWRLWPIVLIAIGLDLVIGRRSAFLSLLIVILLVAGGIFFLTYNGGFQPLGNLATTNLNVPIQGAKSANVIINLGTCNVTVDSTANSESLATGTLEYYQGRSAPQQSVSIASDQAMLNLRQVDGSGFDLTSLMGAGRSPEWAIHLNPDVPLTFNADLGTGNSTIDLSRSKASVVNINSGTGNATIVFPAGAGNVSSTVNGGVGNLNLTIPSGLEARIDISKGLGNIDVDDSFVKQGDNAYTTKGYGDAKNKLDLKLNMGVGNVEISR